MPSSYQYYPINNFPMLPERGREWSTNRQMTLPDENIADDAQSIIKYSGISEYQDYHKYYVRHETLKETWIRIDKEDRKKVIFVEEFYIFTPPNFSYTIIKAKNKITNELMRRIHIKHPDFEYSLREVDLMQLKNNLHPQVRGGWFRDLEIEDVSTAAIFGTNVSDSDEWDKYSSFGTLSSLVIEFKHRGEQHSVNISLIGSITLYSNYDEAFALDLVERFNSVVMRYQKEVQIKPQKGSRKTK